MRPSTILAMFALLSAATPALADDEDNWELLPPNVTSTVLKAEHADLIASAGVSKPGRRLLKVTYWRGDGETYRCLDLLDVDEVIVDAYCYREKRKK